MSIDYPWMFRAPRLHDQIDRQLSSPDSKYIGMTAASWVVYQGVYRRVEDEILSVQTHIVRELRELV